MLNSFINTIMRLIEVITMSKKKEPVISVANLPDEYTFSRDPLERQMEAQEIMAEMGICPHCKEVGPCGCPNPNAEEEEEDPRFKNVKGGRIIIRGIDTT